jgi:hypothetical protein
VSIVCSEDLNALELFVVSADFRNSFVIHMAIGHRTEEIRYSVFVFCTKYAVENTQQNFTRRHVKLMLSCNVSYCKEWGQRFR